MTEPVGYLITHEHKYGTATYCFRTEESAQSCLGDLLLHWCQDYMDMSDANVTATIASILQCIAAGNIDEALEAWLDYRDAHCGWDENYYSWAPLYPEDMPYLLDADLLARLQAQIAGGDA
jgi:hypothetical protein